MILFRNVSLSRGKSTTRFGESPFFRRKVALSLDVKQKHTFFPTKINEKKIEPTQEPTHQHTPTHTNTHQHTTHNTPHNTPHTTHHNTQCRQIHFTRHFSHALLHTIRCAYHTAWLKTSHSACLWRALIPSSCHPRCVFDFLLVASSFCFSRFSPSFTSSFLILPVL